MTAFTIEPSTAEEADDETCPNADLDVPIQAVMTTKGYIVPNPVKKNRVSIWFTGGTIELNDPNNAQDVKHWNAVFDKKNMPKRNFGQRSKLFVAGLVLGATVPGQLNSDGTMNYELKRPIGGHDTAFVEILFMDETIRIAKAQNGVVYVFARVPKEL